MYVQKPPSTNFITTTSTTRTELCSICCQQKPRGNLSIDHLRLPEICYQCWYSHIKNYISRISYRVGESILSPFSQGQPLDVVFCLNSLKKEHGVEIQEMLFRKYSAFNKEIQKCPSQTCDFVYIGQKCKWNSKQNIYNCPKCQMPLTANKSLTFKSLMASFYLIMANKCPKCDIPIEKISGCPHMTCPCGHHFCWYCYKDHPSGTLKRIYQLHTIPECAFIFLSKIVLFIICCVNLLITFNGNWVIKSLFGFLGVVFSVLWRALLMDGFILLQVMFFMMQKRKRSYSPNTFIRTRNTIIAFILINILALVVLYMVDEFVFFMEILFGEIVLAALGFGIGYGVVYSVETWFQYVM